MHGKAIDKVRTRASFDFGCAPEVFEITVLETVGTMGGPYPTSVGVTGCDDGRAVYVWEGSSYILNSVSGMPAQTSEESTTTAE